MQTLGSLIDSLTTVNLKMWNAQEGLYKIRHMTWEEFYIEYDSNPDKLKELYEFFKKSCDLNYQRNCLIDEIDIYFGQTITNRIRNAMGLEELKEVTMLKHKTY